MVSLYLEEYLKEINETIDALEVVSPYEYIFKGHRYQIDDSEKIYINRPIVENKLLSHMQNTFYQTIHCRIKEDRTSFPLDLYDNNVQNFVDSLSQANSGLGTWDPGWKIKMIENGGIRLAVHKDDLCTVWVQPHQFSLQDGFLEIGKKVKIRMEKEYRSILPGFYMAVSNAEYDSQKANGPLVRIYWNIKVSHASSLVESLTRELNIIDIPFHFKILNSPYHYPRADAAVAYIKKEYLGKSKKAISKIYHELESGLLSPTPLFAKRLAPGISLAEDPGNNSSFGVHLCNIFAESLYSAYKEDITGQRRLDYVKQYFENLNIHLLTCPHINANSIDDYDMILGAL